MPNDTQRQTLASAVAMIRAAEQALLQAGQNSTDAVELGKINLQYSHLDSLMSQLLHAQAVADDTAFAATTAALKQQAATLQAQEDAIKKIISDVALAAQIIGYITQAAGFIAGL